MPRLFSGEDKGKVHCAASSLHVLSVYKRTDVIRSLLRDRKRVYIVCVDAIPIFVSRLLESETRETEPFLVPVQSVYYRRVRIYKRAALYWFA